MVPREYIESSLQNPHEEWYFSSQGYLNLGQLLCDNYHNYLLFLHWRLGIPPLEDPFSFGLLVYFLDLARVFSLLLLF